MPLRLGMQAEIPLSTRMSGRRADKTLMLLVLWND